MGSSLAYTAPRPDGAAGADPSRDPLSIPGDVKASIRVLVVDDERTLRESCSSVLQMDGYNVTIVGRGVFAVVVTLALTAWLQTARTVRAGFLQVRELEYIEAARAVGVPARRIVTRHILPNVFQPVVVLIAVGIGSAILAEAALSFLGVGVQDPDPSLGKMINDAQSRFIESPSLLIFP